MRKPHQILVFPYKKDADGNYLYGIFSRVGNFERWQGIAGGVEDGESYLEACRRELNEEAGISYDAKIIELESISTIPVVNIVKDFIWGMDTYLIYEHCFGVDATSEEIKLSREHDKMEWLNYEDAVSRLQWDSNKNALWELNERLKRM